jgi:uncharacterized protein
MNSTPSSGKQDGADPSMEEILASIRRILNEDDPPQPAAASPEEDVLVLDDSMMVPVSSQPEVQPEAPTEPHEAEAQAAPVHETQAHRAETHAHTSDESAEPPDAITTHAPVTPEPILEAPAVTEAAAAVPPPAQAMGEPEVAPRAEAAPAEPERAPLSHAADPAAQLVAPEAAAAAAYALGSLVRTLAADRKPAVWSGGPTLEDLVRAELRPMLKAWLDANLPPVVERLVRTEIERVVGRAIP